MMAVQTSTATAEMEEIVIKYCLKVYRLIDLTFEA
jgi:hypothetical protein